MTPIEISKVLDKIQAYRQSFLITKTVLNEWSRILEPYDYKDVDDKLNDFFKDGTNYGKFPEAYQLVKYLTRISDKDKRKNISVNCIYCKRTLDLSEFDTHTKRCSSVKYLYDNFEKFLNIKLDKAKLYSMSDGEFDRKYDELCKRLLEKLPECSTKKHLEEYFDHITNVDENGRYKGPVKTMELTSEEMEMMLD